MKKTVRRLLASMFFVLFVFTSASAQESSLDNGKVYSFVNKLYPEKALTANSLTSVGCSTTDTSDYTQLWYVTTTTDGNYQLRNLGNGYYLVGNGTSSDWTLASSASAANTTFTLSTVGGTYNALMCTGYTGGYGYMHCNSSSKIVGWSTSDGSQWTISEVTISEDALTTNWAQLAAIQITDEQKTGYQTALNNLFTDAACTTLNSTYSAMSADEIKADENYIALPAALQAMVLKVKSGDWSEANSDSNKPGWDNEHSKKFRVQMVEPYSMPNNMANALGIQAHNNHNNPTGLFANNREALYVMVEGEIKDGAELYLSSLTGHSKFGADYKSGASCVALSPGLNVVPCYGDDHSFYIQYVVKTFTDDGEKLNPLSGYPKLKIHIEGGHVNGFFDVAGDDLYTYDTDEDWTYYKERANMADILVLGRHIALLFPLNNADTEGNKGLGTYWLDYIDDLGNTISDDNGNSKACNIHKIVEAWDRIVMSQFATMGLLHKDSIAKLNNKFPRWYTGKDGSQQRGEVYTYNGDDPDTEYPSDYSDYFNHRPLAFGVGGNTYMYGSWDHTGYNYNTMESILTQIADEAGPTWGPAHEIGHQHQGLLTLNGLTEVTNNLFSNIAVWYMGMGTSRVNDSSLATVLNAYNTDGNDFYTNGIWEQTQMYYHLWLYYHLCGNNTKFYPRLFEMLRRDPMQNGSSINGEDGLLKFYKHACVAAGEDLTEFFRAYGFLEVMDNRLVGDYSSAYYTQTQEEIDRVVAEVKALGYKENLAVLLISDDVAGATYVSHDGVTPRSDWDGSTAELGSYTDFISGTEAGDYTVTANADGTITMSGSGGVGFIILDADGKILSFSTNTTFALSDEAAYAVATGAASTVSVASDGDPETTETIDTSELQYDLLAALINKVQAIADITETDGTYTHIGYYKQSAVAELNTALETAKEVYDAQAGGYGAAYELLYSKYAELLANNDATVPFSSAHVYKLVNYAYPARTMSVNTSSNIAALTDVDATTTPAAQWSFVETGTYGVYYVKNAAGQYATEISSSSALGVTTDQSSAATYTVDNLGNGLWTVTLNSDDSYRSFHAAANDSYQVVGWETGAPATKWRLTAITPSEAEVNKLKLQDLAAKTTTLLDKVATISYTTEAITLQAGDPNQDYYILCNNPDPSEGGGAAALLDNTPSTYLHSNWHSASSTNDYLQVNLGSGNGISALKFSEVTRSGADSDFPKYVEILGSNDGSSWYNITTVSGLPQSAGASWESDGISLGDEFTYLRFIITTGTNRIYFHMAEFDLYKATPVATINAALDDATVTPALAVAAHNELAAATLVLNNSSYTASEVAAQYTALKEDYDALAAAYETAVKANITTANASLQTLIDQTMALLEKAGTVTVPTCYDILPLQTTDETANFYIWTNAPNTGGNSEGPIANLVDGSTDNFFHTQWDNSAKSSDGLEHYVEVDLGEGKSLEAFKFNYTARSGVANDYPQTMEIYGSNEKNTTGDESAYTLITTISEGLPSSSAGTYTSSVITDGNKYRYLRFMVTTTNIDRTSSANGSNEHNYWHMAEFDITSADETEISINTAYTGFVTDALMLTTNNAISDATKIQAIATTVEQVENQQAALQQAYNNLAAAIEKAESAAVDVTLLQTLVSSMATLLAEATTTGQQGEIALQATNADSDFYLWSDYTAGDSNGIGALVDDNTGTFFGTVWSGGSVDSYTHWIAIDLGAYSLSEFTFDYTTRNSTHSDQRPTGIKILGSNSKDGEYTEITTIEEGLPTDANTLYTHTTAIEPAEYYRYIRFAVATEVGYFNMSEFNLYSAADALFTVSDKYTLASLPIGELATMWAAQKAAQAFIASADAGETITQGEYNSLLDALQTQYDALSAYKVTADATAADVAEAKTTLDAAITELQTLLKTVATPVKVAADTEFTLSATAGDSYYISSNAGHNTADGNAAGYTDGAGIAGLLDDDASTYFHSRWGGTAVNEAHYLQVDLGEGNQLSDFVFEYAARHSGWASNNSPAPTAITVSVSNDADFTTSETLATLTTDANGLPLYTDDGATLWQSPTMSASEAVRYLRFTVTASSGPGGTTFSGYNFFAMGTFNLYPTVESAADGYSLLGNYASSLYVTQTLVDDTYTELTAATAVSDNGTATVSDVTAATTAVNAQITELQAAIDKADYPVLLTTDTANPHLYQIRINRSSTTVLQYNATDTKVSVAEDDNRAAQVWYFMEAADGKFNIYPYNAEGAMLATNSFAEGIGKVTAQQAAADGYSYDWSITPITGSEWYNISIPNAEGTTYYFSNYGGVSNKMGFYNSSNTTDGGSMFKFEPITTEEIIPDAYATLEDYLSTVASIDESRYGHPGLYTAATATAFNTAYDAAAALVQAGYVSGTDYTTPYDELVAAKAALAIEPTDALVDGGVYRILNVVTNTTMGNEFHYIVNGTTALTATRPTAASGYWVYQASADGAGTFISAVGDNALGWKEIIDGATPTTYTVAAGTSDSYYSLYNSDESRYLAVTNEAWGTLGFNQGTGTTQSTNWSTDFVFEEVSRDDWAGFTASVYDGTNGDYGTLHLPFAVTLPAGVTANSVTLNDTGTELVETAIVSGGEVLPALTPVLLTGTAGSHTFAPAASLNTEQKETGLSGTLAATEVEGTAYILAYSDEENNSGEILFYLLDSSDNTVNANKAYYVGSTESASSYLRLGGGTTGIGSVDASGLSDGAIYDLTGRRLREIPAPGIYIVNGKKVFIK